MIDGCGRTGNVGMGTGFHGASLITDVQKCAASEGCEKWRAGDFLTKHEEPCEVRFRLGRISTNKAGKVGIA